MQVTRLPQAFGASIEGIDLRRASDAELSGVLAALLENRFVVIPGQTLENDDYVAYGRRWGTPVLLISKKGRLPSHPEMIVQSNRPTTIEHSRNVANHWHSDSSYEEEVSTVTMLYGIEAPQEGGYTLFADTVAAFAALPAEKQREYEHMTVLHKTAGGTTLPGETMKDFSQVPPEELANFVELAPVAHPLVMRHPVTGRKALYGLGGSPYGIEGMSAEESGELILALRRHATQEKFVSRHKLQPREVLMWDNLSVMHRATPIDYTDEPGLTRLNYRISVKGLPEFA